VVAATVIANPHLWNALADPYLYQAFVEVWSGTNVVDLEAQPLGNRERRTRTERLIHQLNLGHVRTTRGYALSGGERRRVEIARALCIQPNFILLDEPFSGIDPIAVLELQKIIFELKAGGIGVLITDHNVRETLSVTDRAYIIAEGRIIFSGTPHELGNNPDVRRLYLGEGFSLG